MVVEKIIGKIEDFPIDKLEVERVVLDHYGLAKPHQKITSTSGEVIAISLPHGEALFYGAVLYADNNKIIVVDLEVEDVIEIRPRTTMEWAGVAYNIGNMHSSAYFTKDTILIPYDASLDGVVKKLGVEYKRDQKKLAGLKANTFYGGHHHHHD
ncbi:MAG: urease accessory protein UreE [Anaerovoracaceae bacterium]